MFFTLFTCADPLDLGRVDKDSLPQSALMELLVRDLERVKSYFGRINHRRPIEEWRGVSLNEIADVIEIHWGRLWIGGNLPLRWMPSTVQTLAAMRNELNGSVDLTQLPERLQNISLSHNKFSGEIDLAGLPSGMITLRLAFNLLRGPISLSCLPYTLQTLELNDNALCGEINFDSLPHGITLNLSNNIQLAGSIHGRFEDVYYIENTLIEVDFGGNS